MAAALSARRRSVAPDRTQLNKDSRESWYNQDEDAYGELVDRYQGQREVDEAVELLKSN